MTELFETKEYRPSYSKFIQLVIFGALFVAGGVFLYDPNAELQKQLLALGAILLGALSIVPRLFALFAGRPKIVLSPDGIELRSVIKTIRHSWRDVGVFAARTQSVYYTKIRYLCAFTDTNHDTIHPSNQFTSATTYNADISFAITDLADGRSDKKAEAMAQEFNRWRLKYGAPENNALHVTAEDRTALIKQKKRKNLTSIAIIFVFLAAFVAAKIYF